MPTASHAAGFFFCRSLADPNLLVFIRSVSPSTTQAISTPPLMPPLSREHGAHLLPAPLPSHFSAHFRGQCICSSNWFSLSLLRALLKFRSWVMTVDKSLPLSQSLCPCPGRRQLEWMVSGPHRTEVTLPNTVHVPLEAQVSLSEGRLVHPSKAGQSSYSLDCFLICVFGLDKKHFQQRFLALFLGRLSAALGLRLSAAF